ncbi:MAG TPA: hypothetical protein VE623_15975 [Acidimicrobiales bacterium]|nr:hypothetical protein [Acidimicrobiales bacterium]
MGTDAEVALEPPLQRPGADPEVVGDLLDPGDVGVGHDVVHGVVDQRRLGRAPPAPALQERLHAPDGLVGADLGVAGADTGQLTSGLGPQDLGCGHGLVRQPGRPLGRQRREAGGPEPHADHPALADQHPPEAPGDDPVTVDRSPSTVRWMLGRVTTSWVRSSPGGTDHSTIHRWWTMSSRGGEGGRVSSSKCPSAGPRSTAAGTRVLFAGLVVPTAYFATRTRRLAPRPDQDAGLVIISVRRRCCSS